MSNPPLLTAHQSLELLARLQEALARLTAVETQTLGDLQKRELALQRQTRDARTRAQMAEETKRTGEESVWAEWLEEAQTRHTARRVRIQTAYAQSTRALQVLAQRKKDQYLGDLQMRHFRAERQQPEELKKLEKAHAETTAGWTAQHGTLLSQVRRVAKVVGKVPGLRKAVVERSASETPGEVAAENLAQGLLAVEEKVVRLEGLVLPRSLPLLPFLVLALAAGLVVLGVTVFSQTPLVVVVAGAVLLPLLVGVWMQLALRQASPLARELAGELVMLQQGVEGAMEAGRQEHEQGLGELNARYAAEFTKIAADWELGDDVARRFAQKRRAKLETQMLRVLGRHDRAQAPKRARAEAERTARQTATRQLASFRDTERQTAAEAEAARLEEEKSRRWAPLQQQWEQEVLPLYHRVEAARGHDASTPWPTTAAAVEQWTPASAFAEAITFGRLELDLAAARLLPTDPRLALPGPAHVELPLSLVFPEQGSVLFETAGTGETVVIGLLNSLILRFFTAVPPGKLHVTIIDPVGLGQNFAGLMTLGDYEESLINRRIWTQREQIDERLAELNEHIEKMIQMYLRDEFATISQYNVQAGTVAEKYHLLVVADFPSGFSETAARRLQSIAVSGPRCGVFTLIHRDTRQPFPEGLVAEELRQRSVCLQRLGSGYGIDPAQNRSGAALVLEEPPSAPVAMALVHGIGRTSVDANRVEVPFAHIAPPAGALWQSETASELRVPIGRTGATKLQYLSIGKGTRQHALFAGKTGSGKSTLFHVIITNLALWSSPEEVEFYLIDFKKGVEFKCYASQRLPHARVVAIESDREFALSVLQRVDEELRRRGDLFRALGVQDVAGYKRQGGAEPMPRSLLIIDEFQEFFVEDDTVAQSAALLFDRIVRQGRAFGIHVLLGSQTLGGAYTLARATLGQMAIRVALQCNEADAYLIMDENNAAPRLLSRPGEGIYNDAAGALEGNSPFQVVWLSDEERDRRLEEIRALAEARHLPVRTPVVFEGNAPAAIAENDLLRALLAAVPEHPPAEARIWLGAPNAIKGPTEVRFRRQSGNHLLIVGQREEAALTMLALSLLALGAQYPTGAARFYVFASAPSGSPELEFLQQAIRTMRHEVTLVRGGEIGAAMEELSTELKARAAQEDQGGEAPATFLLVQGLQRFKKLKFEDDFSFSSSEDGPGNPGAQLNEIISEGASLGLHLLVTVDTLGNVQRWLNRKALGEFEFRVLFQMSANDSASLIDSPQASGLGLYRALLYNEQEGTTETFRPYAKPERVWLEQAEQRRSVTLRDGPNQ